MSLNANALLTLQEYKDWSGGQVDGAGRDPQLEHLINTASDQIAGIAGRVFQQAAGLVETSDGRGSPLLYLLRPPIAVLTTLEIRSQALWETVASDAYVVDADSGLVRLVPDQSVSATGISPRTFPLGIQNVRATYTGGYSPIPSTLKLICRMQVDALKAVPKRAPQATRRGASGAFREDAAFDASGLVLQAAQLLQGYVRPRIWAV